MSELNQITRDLWGGKYTFTPVLIDKVFGDGGQYLAVSPIMLRPYFYIVRVGKDWDGEIYDHLDAIWDAIEEECGSCCEDEGHCECSGWEVLPAVKGYEGCTWYDLTANDLREIGIPVTCAASSSTESEVS